ncbi:MAG TPA: hypothetical protein VFI49_07580 [Rudaea sp.]|nr:hypothetical protein [Rudaea sp.]
MWKLFRSGRPESNDVVQLGASMNLYVTRESVAAGDDVDAPHARTFALPQGASLETALATVMSARYLPSISGGLATWSVASGIPLAVIAQQWPAPRMLFGAGDDLSVLDRAPGLLRLHFNYHAQLDPEIVLEVLRRLRLRAE